MRILLLESSAVTAASPLLNGTVPRADVAKELDVSERTVYRLEEREGLPVIKFGKARRYNLDAVRAWLLSRQQGGANVSHSAHITP